jgi:hypothetical protein
MRFTVTQLLIEDLTYYKRALICFSFLRRHQGRHSPNSSTILLGLFYDFSTIIPPRAFPCFYAQNPSQPQKGKSFPEFGMQQILL